MLCLHGCQKALQTSFYRSWAADIDSIAVSVYITEEINRTDAAERGQTVYSVCVCVCVCVCVFLELCVGCGLLCGVSTTHDKYELVARPWCPRNAHMWWSGSHHH